MKVCKKMLLLTAVIGQIYFGALAMDGVADNEVSGITGTSNMEEGTSYYAGTATPYDIRYPWYDFNLDRPNSKFAKIAPKKVSESNESNESNESSPAIETHRYGMDAIENEVKRVHPLWENTRYYTPKIAWESGGTEPLEQISIHKEEDYFHFITYGLTELHDKESKDQTKSGFGTELTLKLKRGEYKNQSEEQKELLYIVLLLQKFAKYIIQENSIVKPYEDTYLVKGSSLRKSIGIDIAGTSNIVAFITVPDKDLQSLETPYGRVDFIALIGITKKELQAIRNRKITEKELYEKLGTDVTSYTRKSVI